MIKAIGKISVKKAQPAVIDDGRVDESFSEILNDDKVVIIALPRETWNTLQGLARKAGVASAEVISVALEELEKKLKEG